MPLFAKKSLGQHFLSARAYLSAIVAAGNVGPQERVLEIGPGKGTLTSELLLSGARVVALEKDARLLPFLREKFSKEVAAETLSLYEQDALDADPGALGLQNGQYKIVANIPYYITGALLQKFLTARVQPSTIVFLVQKEVAERIARSPKESLLSLSVKAYGAPRYIQTVPRGAFSPMPKVNSAILSIVDISRSNFSDAAHEARLFALLHAGFAHKRKLLARNLEPVLGIPAAEAFAQAGIKPKARAEEVSLSQWLSLASY